MSLIKNIKSVDNLGIYDGKKSFPKDIPDFKKFNLIYGFNGSGKTSLTRLFRSFETQEAPESAPDLKFKLTLNDGSTLTEKNISNTTSFAVKVFNTDFVWSNIKWNSTDPASNGIKPFYYIGKKQKDYAEKVEGNKTSIIKTNGEIVAINDKKTGSLIKVNNEIKVSKEIACKLIKETHNLISGKGYGEKSFQEDVDSIKDDYAGCILDKKSLRDKEDFVAVDKQPEKIGSIATLDIKFNNLRKRCTEACRKDFVSQKIKELEAHQGESDWIKSGQIYHEYNALDKCLLCGNNLTDDRLQKLNLHFNKAYEELRDEVHGLIAELKQYDDHLDNFTYLDNMQKAHLSNESQASFDRLHADLEAKISMLSKNVIKPLCMEMANKSRNLSTKKDITGNPSTDKDLTKDIELLVDIKTQVEKIVMTHDASTLTYQEERHKYRNSIRKHHVSIFYKSQEGNITLKQSLEDKIDALTVQLVDLRSIEHKLDSEKKDYKAPITKINNLIKSYLGDRGISFRERADGALGYELCRNNNESEYKSTLSEGEKTAVAFCYFIALIESGNEFKKEESIVIIDDPISSLDSKSLYTAFGFLKEHVLDVGQVFLMTHNLVLFKQIRDWFNNIKGMTGTKVEKTWGIKGTKGSGLVSYYMLDAVQGINTKRISILSPLSAILERYASEYHYFYDKTLNFDASGDIDHYLMPNVVRKLLESFLSLKSSENAFYSKFSEVCVSHDIKLKEIYELDKFINDYSHYQPESLYSLNETYADVNVMKEITTQVISFIDKVDPLHHKTMNNICQ